MVWKLSHFPGEYPLGHVQLYAAAAAAAVEQASSIWVARAKMAPHQPVAGAEMPHRTRLFPLGQPTAVMHHRVTALPWNGPVHPEPAPATGLGR